MDSNTENEDFNSSVKKLFHGEVMERAAAARQLGHFKEGRAVNLFARALKSENESVVVDRIIEALGDIKDAKATRLIIDLLKEELEKPELEQNTKRLFLIIEGLMKIGDKRALAHIGILLESCHSDIRKLTEEAFECIDPDWKENVKEIV